ncbi:MAG TPA: hypothetical protein VJN43_15065 [Bryobacteraceae bacterium]|nr:hypothetical protein [Bryobacteraceae bacterium]
MKQLRILLLPLLAATVPGWAQPRNPKQPLPQPLQLPASMEETLAISKAGSYLADAEKIQDCPDDADNPLGLCNNMLFGGFVLFASPLSGNIHIRFFPPVHNIAKFEMSHMSGLVGEDVIERGPILFSYPIRGIKFVDAPILTAGEVDLTTGIVQNLTYRTLSLNNKLEQYLRLYPVITTPELDFPGIYGTAIAHFDQRPDGLLDFTFFGDTFVPTGNTLNGLLDDKVRTLLAFCGTAGYVCGMQAPGTSLRPRVRITTREPSDPPCGANCPHFPVNSTQVFNASAFHTLMGDRFTMLNIPELGGPSTGWSHLTGRLYVQFGPPQGDLLPVAIWGMVPDGFLAVPPPFPFPGFGINMLGVDGKVSFPNDSYVATERVLVNDPFDFAVGVIDMKTGRSVGDMLYRGLPFQTLLIQVLTLNAGRIPTDTFRFQAPAIFEPGPNGSLVFRYNSDVFLDFSTFLWPTPDYNPAHAFRAGAGSTLDPFLKFQATAGGVPATVIKSGQISEVSSFGDPVTIKYSIPCDTANKNFSFDYTNSSTESRGGTFHLDVLAAVACSNARGSTAAPGNADIVTFSGFGSWSKDSNRHLVTFQANTASTPKYFMVQVDGGTISNADTILKTEISP